VSWLRPPSVGLQASGTGLRGVRPWALAGGLLFVVSLGYCLFAYAITFGRIADGPRRAGDMLWNLALFTAFALHHSLFARRPVRRAIARAMPPDLERPFYVAVASVLLIVACWSWRPIPGVAWRLEGPAQWLAYVVQAAGVWLTARSAAILGVGELAGLTPSVPDSGGQLEFKTIGPYGWVRHPIYSAWCLIVLAAPVMTATRLEFALVSTFYLVVAIPFEERTLAAHADGYTRYQARVRWRLVPGLY
jgi:methanethiol S-methyltransferase